MRVVWMRTPSSVIVMLATLPRITEVWFHPLWFTLIAVIANMFVSGPEKASKRECFGGLSQIEKEPKILQSFIFTSVLGLYVTFLISPDLKEYEKKNHKLWMKMAADITLMTAFIVRCRKWFLHLDLYNPQIRHCRRNTKYTGCDINIQTFGSKSLYSLDVPRWCFQ